MQCKQGLQHSLPTSVLGLIMHGAWNISLVRKLFSPYIARHILSMDLPQMGGQESHFWCGTWHRQYTIKSGYWWLQARGTIKVNTFLKEFWRLPCLPKWKLSMWKLLNNALPTGYSLARRSIPTSANCLFCIYLCKMFPGDFNY